MSAKIGNTSGIRRIEEKILRIVIGIEFASETSNVIFFQKCTCATFSYGVSNEQVSDWDIYLLLQKCFKVSLEAF